MKQTVLITGCSRGIGLEFARQYAETGWHVLATCRHPQESVALMDLRERHGADVQVHALDVSTAEDIRRLAQSLAEQPVDILLNNAGVYGPEEQGLGSVEPEAWIGVLKVNTIAPLLMAQTFLPNVERGARRIIATVTSLMGSIGDNGSGGYYLYRSSKAAVNMVARSLAVDLKGKRIISVVLHPGWVRTGMGGPQAPASVEESVSSMRRVLDGLTMKESGGFFNVDGERLPW
jgi:NAD(P)-dependent dehydrogenase (short-subunit alcohol dehydrogenase family)